MPIKGKTIKRKVNNTVRRGKTLQRKATNTAKRAQATYAVAARKQKKTGAKVRKVIKAVNEAMK